MRPRKLSPGLVAPEIQQSLSPVSVPPSGRYFIAKTVHPDVETELHLMESNLSGQVPAQAIAVASTVLCHFIFKITVPAWFECNAVIKRAKRCEMIDLVSARLAEIRH